MTFWSDQSRLISEGSMDSVTSSLLFSPQSLNISSRSPVPTGLWQAAVQLRICHYCSNLINQLPISVIYVWDITFGDFFSFESHSPLFKNREKPLVDIIFCYTCICIENYKMSFNVLLLILAEIQLVLVFIFSKGLCPNTGITPNWISADVNSM